jgi:hypothetical protein
MLGGSQSRSVCNGEEKNLATAGNRIQAIQPIAILTELSQLLIIMHIGIFIPFHAAFFLHYEIVAQ